MNFMLKSSLNLYYHEPIKRMRLSTVELENYKKKLIMEYVLPAFGECQRDKEWVVNRIAGICRLQQAVKCQQMEVPGSHENGYLWFSVSGIVHGYYYNNDRDMKTGTRIWKKREFIFDGSSLFHEEDRPDYIEALEPGEILSISYAEMRKLMNELPGVEKHMRHLHVKTEHHYRHLNHLINKPPLQRVKEFEQENPLFGAIASNSTKAMHVGLTRQGYELQLKRLKETK